MHITNNTLGMHRTLHTVAYIRARVYIYTCTNVYRLHAYAITKQHPLHAYNFAHF